MAPQALVDLLALGLPSPLQSGRRGPAIVVDVGDALHQRLLVIAQLIALMLQLRGQRRFLRASIPGGGLVERRGLRGHLSLQPAQTCLDRRGHLVLLWRRVRLVRILHRSIFPESVHEWFSQRT